VLSYFEIAKSLDRFRSLYPRMAIVRDHDKRCIASLMFIRNQRSIARLNAFISYNLLTRRKNDMELLSSYCKDKMMQLPIVSPSYAARFALVNLRNERPRDSESFCKNEGEFEMLFDAASFGQFVGGVDKVHSAADSRGFVNETAYVNPSKGQVNWMRDAKGRLCPIFRFDGIEDKIANLHIHSKELCKYRSDRKS